jgi:hypothetical protein
MLSSQMRCCGYGRGRWAVDRPFIVGASQRGKPLACAASWYGTRVRGMWKEVGLLLA